MAIRMEELDIRAKVPEIPARIDLLELATPTMAERDPAIKAFSEKMQLGAMKRADLPYGPVFASARGEVHYFQASGGLHIRNAAIASQFKTEERPWTGLEKASSPQGTIYRLNAAAGDRLKTEAMTLLREGGLTAREMQPATLELDQWAQMDEKGTVLRSGGGTATVKVGFAVEGIPVAGAGAKSLVYAEPSGAAAAISGLFHVWRPTGARTSMTLGTVESVLAAGLLADPEIMTIYKRGQRVTITSLNLVYLALPAFVAQRHLFPAVQVEGFTSNKDGFEARFGKFVQAIPSAQYVKAGIFAHYLQPAMEDRAAGAMG